MSIKKIAYYLVLLCFMWFPFQDTIISYRFKIYPTTYWRILLVAKEAGLMFILFLLLSRKMLMYKMRFELDEIMGFCYLFVCFGHLMYSTVGSGTQIALFTTFRSGILPVLFVFAGKWLNLNKQEIMLLCKIIIAISIISVLFGVIEVFLPVEVFWNGIFDLGGYHTHIKGITKLTQGIPGNFWGNIFKRRMAGTIGCPLALGYYLIMPILLLQENLFLINKKRIFVLLILFAGLLLTETRAAIAGCVVAYGLYNIDAFKRIIFTLKIRKSLVKQIILVVLVFVCMFIFSRKARYFIVNTANFREGRMISHMKSCMTGVKNIPNVIMIGKGWGTAGGWAALQAGKTVGAGESTYLTLIYQVGGIGLLLFLLWWFLCFYKIKINFKDSEDIFWQTMRKVILSASVVYFLTGFMSEQILSFTSIAHFWILFGVLLGADTTSSDTAK